MRAWVLNWGAPNLSEKRLSWFRTVCYLLLCVEPIYLLAGKAGTPPDEELLEFPLVNLLQLPVDTEWILAARIFFCLLTAIGYYPNVFKFMALAAVFFSYNQNYFVDFNNHYDLQFWMAALSLIPVFPGNFDDRPAGRDDRSVVFWFSLKGLLSAIYLHTFLVKTTLHERDSLQELGMAVDLSLFVLCLVHSVSRYVRIALVAGGTAFHIATGQMFAIGVFPYLMIGLLAFSFATDLRAKK